MPAFPPGKPVDPEAEAERLGRERLRRTLPARPSVVFAGAVEPDDLSAGPDGLLTIDRKPRSLFRHAPDLLARLAEAGIAVPDVMTDSAGARYGLASRSPRPYLITRVPWHREWAALADEDAWSQAARFAATEADQQGFLPGASLEVWSLPVVDFTFPVLLTPAGDWPPAGADG